VNVKFTKKGTFTYFCDVHAGMKATVSVVAKKAKAPSAKSDKKAVAKQVKAAAKAAKAAGTPTVPANSVYVGSAGKGGVEVFAMFPDAQTVPVGTTVKFQMSPGSVDVHTATTGPTSDPDLEKDTTSYLGQIAASFNSPTFRQEAVYPSEAPGTTGDLSPALHGNGFWGTGIMDTNAASPLPSEGSVKIAQAGTYTFYCLIHPFMSAKITAQ